MDVTPEISTLQALGATEGKKITATVAPESKKVVDDMVEMVKHRDGKEMIKRAGELGAGQITAGQIDQLKDRLMTKSRDAAGNEVDDPATVELIGEIRDTAVFFEAHRRASAQGVNPDVAIGNQVLAEYGLQGQNWAALEDRVLDRFLNMDVVRGALPQLWELKFQVVAANGAARPATQVEEGQARKDVLRELLVESPRLRAEMGKEMKRVVDSVTEKVAGTPQELAEKEAELAEKNGRIGQIEARVKRILASSGMPAGDENTIWINNIDNNPGDAGVISRTVLREVFTRLPGHGDQNDLEDKLRQIRDKEALKKTIQDSIPNMTRGQNAAANITAATQQIATINGEITPLISAPGVRQYLDLKRAIEGEIDSSGRVTGGIQAEIASLKTLQAEKSALGAEVTGLKAKRTEAVVRYKLEHVRMLEQAPVVAITKTLESAYDDALKLNQRKMAAAEAKAVKDHNENLALGIRLVRTGMDGPAGEYVHFDVNGKRIAGNTEFNNVKADILGCSRFGAEWRKRIILRHLAGAGGPIQLRESGQGLGDGTWDKFPLEKLDEKQRKLIDEVDVQLGDQILKKLLTDYSQLTKAGEGWLARRGAQKQLEPGILENFYKQFQDVFKAELEKIKDNPEVKKALEKRGLKFGLLPPSLLTMLLLAMGIGAASLGSLTGSK